MSLSENIPHFGIDSTVEDKNFSLKANSRPFLKRKALTAKPRYYYETFDSSLECSVRYSYTHKRQFDEEKKGFKFIKNRMSKT